MRAYKQLHNKDFDKFIVWIAKNYGRYNRFFKQNNPFHRRLAQFIFTLTLEYQQEMDNRGRKLPKPKGTSVTDTPNDQEATTKEAEKIVKEQGTKPKTKPYKVAKPKEDK